jgi:aryl-alcohol dehydrogenase-like predicted oxidoreductase
LMRYKLLGKSGLRVSELCLGAMTFGEDWGWGSAREESRQIFDAFMEAGGNFVDTANIYTMGTSEEFLGEFIAAERERVVLATKYTNTVKQGDPNSGGNHRKSMVQSVEASLRRLKTDYIDLFWLHIWDGMTPIEEVMRAFDDLVRAGKILYAGVSDAPAWWVARANTLAELRGWTPFVGLQIEYSLVERTVERELLPMARALDIGVTAWSPLASGLLTGKYNKPAAEATSEADAPRLDQTMGSGFVERSERNLGIAAEVVRIAEETGRSPAQVALNWVRAKGTIPIIGARRLSQFKDNLASLDFALADEHVRRLDEVSAIEPGFPHEFYGKDIVRNMVYGGTYDLIDNHRA